MRSLHGARTGSFLSEEVNAASLDNGAIFLSLFFNLGFISPHYIGLDFDYNPFLYYIYALMDLVAIDFSFTFWHCNLSCKSPSFIIIL